MYNFSTGIPRKALLNDYHGDLAFREKGVSSEIVGESPFYDTVQGNLALVRREIETMTEIENKAQKYPWLYEDPRDISFIHLDDNRVDVDDPSIGRVIERANLTEEERENIEVYYDKAAKVGRSIFLEYPSSNSQIAAVTTGSGAIQGDFDSGGVA